MGDLRIEFFKLLKRAILETYMAPTGCVQNNSVALQVKYILSVSRLLAILFISTKYCV